VTEQYVNVTSHRLF